MSTRRGVWTSVGDLCARSAELTEDPNEMPDYSRSTPACLTATSILRNAVEEVKMALHDPNRALFLGQLGVQLHSLLLTHIQRFSFNDAGGLRLKRDLTEYAELVASFHQARLDSKFAALGALANLFIVPLASLPSLMMDGSLQLAPKETEKFIALRSDYHTITERAIGFTFLGS
ncbi:Exocyst complex component 5 [Cymbomonas tetramitiformis]|uniref:Exocyst complex component 5 n=1 Tax=Cymbomonas tetramitiformis TaxID=36881 RepID=A0AAE0C966_9CHLO|nr:Exocyst complex component 5 [Cymbomonas tetramitiformis]